MKGFFKDKFFYIITAVALILTIFPIVLTSMGHGSILRDAVGVVVSPVQKLFNYTADAVDGFFTYFRKMDSLIEENKALQAEVEQLREDVYEAEELKKIYSWTADFLEMKVKHSDFKMLEAAVTGHSSGYSRTLMLDVGTSSGVDVNMPVVTSGGLLGRISEVGPTWARVSTLIDPGMSVGAFIESTDETGVCSADIELSDEGLCYLNYIGDDSKVQIGDRVFTSGYGGVFPRGLLIGVVKSIEADPYNGTLRIVVDCVCDFKKTNDVMVIISYEQTAIPAGNG